MQTRVTKIEFKIANEVKNDDFTIFEFIRFTTSEQTLRKFEMKFWNFFNGDS